MPQLLKPLAGLLENPVPSRPHPNPPPPASTHIRRLTTAHNSSPRGSNTCSGLCGHLSTNTQIKIQKTQETMAEVAKDF